MSSPARSDRGGGRHSRTWYIARTACELRNGAVRCTRYEGDTSRVGPLRVHSEASSRYGSSAPRRGMSDRRFDAIADSDDPKAESSRPICANTKSRFRRKGADGCGRATVPPSRSANAYSTMQVLQSCIGRMCFACEADAPLASRHAAAIAAPNTHISRFIEPPFHPDTGLRPSEASNCQCPTTLRPPLEPVNWPERTCPEGTRCYRRPPNSQSWISISATATSSSSSATTTSRSRA